MIHYWRAWPNRATAPAGLFWVSALVVTPIFLLGAAGVSIHARRKPPGVFLLLIAPLAGLLGALPFVFHLRLRYPTVDLFLIILAAAAVSEILTAARSGKRFESQTTN